MAAGALARSASLLSHALPVRPAIKARLVIRIGARGGTLAYSALPVLALAMLIAAARRARAAAQGAMLAVCLIVALAAFAPNPLFFGGWRNRRFAPARPGIIGRLRPPFLIALVLWAAGHLPANGDLAHALIFAGFAAFALLGMAKIYRRRWRDLGPEEQERPVRGKAELPRFWPLRLLPGLALGALPAAPHPRLIGPAVWP